MKKETSTGFFWDVQKWRASRSVQRMSFAERGVYRDMLDEQWDQRNLPDDAQAVADLIAASESQVAEVLAAWPAVRPKFVTSRGDRTRIYNAALEQTRRKQVEYRRRREVSGSKGGKAKAAKSMKKQDLQASNATEVLESAVANPSVLNRSDLNRSDLRREEQQQRSPGGRPMVGYRRLKIWRWMLDDLIASLGAHGESFDLDDWLSELDRGVQILPAAQWPWLKQAMVSECRRRGLPVADDGDPLGKQSNRLMAAVAGLSDQR